MKHLLMAVPVAMALLLSACGGPTFDGSSAEKAQSSMQAMTEELSEDKKREFAMAFASLTSQHAMSLMGAAMSDPLKAQQKMQESSEQLMKELDGKSVDDIIDMANALKDKN